MSFVVYLDVFFCVNVGMNVVLLILFQFLFKQKSSAARVMLASALGGVGACIVVVYPRLNLIMRFLFLYVLVSMGMIIIAFTYKGVAQLLQDVIKLYCISFFMGGIFHYLYYNMQIGKFIKELQGHKVYQNSTVPFLIVVNVVLLVLFPVLSRLYHQMIKQLTIIYSVELWYEGNCIRGLGLYDTGNLLMDPVSGKPVIIAQYDTVKKILSLELQEYIQNYFLVKTTTQPMTKIKWIPYHSIGQKNGFMPGIVFQKMKVEIDGKKKEIEQVLVGLYEGSLSAGKEYQFILHEEYLSTNYYTRRK